MKKHSRITPHLYDLRHVKRRIKIVMRNMKWHKNDLFQLERDKRSLLRNREDLVYIQRFTKGVWHVRRRNPNW